MPTAYRRSYLINALVVLCIFGLVFAVFEYSQISNTYRGLFTLAGIYAVLAVSLNLSTGLLGELCLGHAGFMSVGAYTAAVCSIQWRGLLPSGLSFLLALLVGGLVACFFGVVVGIPALRLRGDYLAITTLAFGEIIKVLVRTLPITGGGQPLVGVPLVTDYGHAYWMLVLCITVIYMLIRSRHGRAIISIREDDIASEACGINTTKYKIFAFALSAFFAGMAGGLYAHYQGMLEPQIFDYNQSIHIMVMVVFGGIGSLTGSVIAAAVLTVLPELLRGFSAYRSLIYAVLLILLMLYRPEGLLGQKELSQAFFARLFRRGKHVAFRSSGVGGSAVEVRENLPASGSPDREAQPKWRKEALERRWKGRR